MSDVSKYVQQQPNGIYRYYRRVPIEIAHSDKRKFVRVSLKTKDHRVALDKAADVHTTLEAMWAAMAAGNDNVEAWERHANAVRLAQSLGFTYLSTKDIAAGSAEVLQKRLEAADMEAGVSRAVAEAVTGQVPEADPKISNIWKLYEHHGRANMMGMSPRQLAKHGVSRKRAIKYLQELLGDIPLSQVTRESVLRFRDWWVAKIEKDGLRAYSANRSITDIAGMLTVIDAALRSNFHAVWEKVRIKETNATKLGKRLPFPAAWVQERFLAPGALDSMNLQARLIVYTMIETGMRLGEVCNLRAEDIRLDDEVPHVEVAERADRRQKTEYSIRRIPLVGVSLWAMRQAREGFPRYADNGDGASAAINKQIDEIKLRPTKRHTIYSLRHTFQDRILAAGAQDRMQADLMGHEFGRPSYGDGAEMKQRQELLEKIKFAWDMDAPSAP